MMEIPLFVVFLQIGFNAALSNRGSNPLIPSRRYENAADLPGEARDEYPDYSLENTDASDSIEQYSFRSFHPIQDPYDFQRSSRKENYVSLDTSPADADGLQSPSSSSRRSSPNYRRPYSAQRPPDFDRDQTRKSYSKANGESNLKVSSLEGGNPEDASRLGEGNSYLDSLISLIEQSKNRRSHNSKSSRRGNNLSDDASPIDKLDAVYSPNSHNERRNNRKEHNQNNLNTRRSSDGVNIDDEDSINLSPFRGLKPGLKSHKLTNSSPLTRRVNRKNNKELLLDGDKTGQLTFLHLSSLEDLNLESPLLRSHDQNNRRSNSRNYLSLSISPNNEASGSDLSELLTDTLNELNLVPVNLRRTGSSSNKYDGLSVEDDDFSNPSDLRVGSLDITKSELPLRRSSSAYRNHRRNLRQHGNNRAALRKLFDEETAKTLVPYHENEYSKVSSSGSQNNSRRDDEFSDEFSLDTLFDFKKDGNDDKMDLNENLSVISPTKQNMIPESPLLRSSDENVSTPTTQTLLLEYPWTNGLTSRKNKSSTLRSQTNLRNNKVKYETANNTDILILDYPWTDGLSPSKNKTSGLSSQTLLTGELKDTANATDTVEDNAADTNDTLHLDKKEDSATDVTDSPSPEKEAYNASDPLDPDSDEDKNIFTSLEKSKPLLRSPEQQHDNDHATYVLPLGYPWNSPKHSERRAKGTDKSNILKLEYPWNDPLSSNSNKKKLIQRSRNQNTKVKNTTDVLQLQYPWNGELSSNSKKGKIQLRSNNQNKKVKGTTDVLQLEYPWNDPLSSNSNKKKLIQRNRNQNTKAKGTTDVLQLQYPWNGELSSNSKKDKTKLRSNNHNAKIEETIDALQLQYPWNDPFSSNSKKHKMKLRSNNHNTKVKETTDILKLDYPWNGALSSSIKRGKIKLRSNNQNKKVKNTADVLHLKYPWNDPLSSNSNKNKLKVRSDDRNKKVKDVLQLQYPWNGALSPDENKIGLKVQSHKRRANRRQDKEPKEVQIPGKPSSKKTAVKVPEPFYIHPHLRRRNINKHPNYFRRSYDQYSERLRLENLKHSPFKRSNRNQNVVVLRNAENLETSNMNSDSNESSSDVITFPSDRKFRRRRFRRAHNIAEGTPSLVTVTERPNNNN